MGSSGFIELYVADGGERERERGGGKEREREGGGGVEETTCAGVSAAKD